MFGEGLPKRNVFTCLASIALPIYCSLVKIYASFRLMLYKLICEVAEVVYRGAIRVKVKQHYLVTAIF